jgi:two-component system sensor histidine kinase/response regulator
MSEENVTDRPATTSHLRAFDGTASNDQAKQLRTILEIAFDAVIEMDCNGVITGWGSKAESVFGWTQSEMLGRVLFDVVVAPRHREPYKQALAELVAWQENPVANKWMETGALRRDGGQFDLEVILSVLRRGGSCQVTIFARDISERKQLEKSLRISEERTRAILDRIEDGCFEVGLSDEGKYLFVNHGFCEITGYSAEEMLGKSFREFFDAETSEQLTLAYGRVYETGEPLKAYEYALTRKDGTKRYVEESVSLKKDSQGLPVAFIGIRRDSTERKLAEEKIRVSEERYRVILEQIGEGYFEVDLKGRYQFFNGGYCRMLRCSPSDILGQSYKKVVPAEQIPMIQEVFRKVLQTGEPVKSFEYETVRPDGSAVFAEESISLKKDGHGQPEGFHVIIRDITERKRAEQELAAAKDAAEASNRAKSTFLATMSHEIRTPMNGILGMTELVLDTELAQEQREHLSMVKSCAESLLSIINDVLDFSKIEAEKLELESIPFDLRDSLGETMKVMSFRAHEKGLELIYDVQPDVPEGLAGDPTRIRQIVVNLVGNAIKFTERGEVVVTVEQAPEEPGDGGCACLRFSVRDTGVGIPADKLEKVFEAFSQADGTMARKYGGSGLGLAICTRLVEKMSGRIWVESESEKGSTFRFVVRLRTQKTPPERLLALPPEALEDMPVLIIDDNHTNRRVLDGMLNRWGMKPMAVEGGKAALQALEVAKRAGHPFPLVLLDGHMPEMDGFMVAERIQKNPELAGATIMMLTSGGVLGGAARCRELGIKAYLVKPIQQAELLEAICLLIQKSAPKAPANLITRHTLREARHRLVVLLVEDNAVNRKLAVALLEKRGFAVTTAENGKLALAALEKQTFDFVLMDLQMPEMDGITATETIREREKSTGAHIPVIAMTAHAMKEDQERCLAAGMDAYVTKPIRTSELFQTIERTLETFRSPAVTVDQPS